MYMICPMICGSVPNNVGIPFFVISQYSNKVNHTYAAHERKKGAFLYAVGLGFLEQNRRCAKIEVALSGKNKTYFWLTRGFWTE